MIRKGAVLPSVCSADATSLSGKPLETQRWRTTYHRRQACTAVMTRSKVTGVDTPAPLWTSPRCRCQARSAMTTANNVSPQSRLWNGRSINCSAPPFARLAPGVLVEPCVLKMQGRTFGNMSLLPDPFLAQLPSNYSTNDRSRIMSACFTGTIMMA